MWITCPTIRNQTNFAFFHLALPQSEFNLPFKLTDSLLLTLTTTMMAPVVAEDNCFCLHCYKALSKHHHLVEWRRQCNQIRRILILLGDKFSYKCSPIIKLLFELFQTTMLCQLFGQLFIPSSGHTAGVVRDRMKNSPKKDPCFN